MNQIKVFGQYIGAYDKLYPPESVEEQAVAYAAAHWLEPIHCSVAIKTGEMLLAVVFRPLEKSGDGR